MNKLIITEQEKKYILNLYKKNKLILEEIIDGPYGLKYDTEKNSMFTNFKDVFGVDVEKAEMIDEESMLVTFDSFNSLKIDFKKVSVEQVKNVVTKIKNNTLKGADIYVNNNRDKFPEFFDSLRSTGTFKGWASDNTDKPCDFKLHRNKYNFYLIKKGLIFNGVFVPASQCEGNKVAYIEFWSNLEKSQVFLMSGQKVLDHWEVYDDNSFSVVTTGEVSAAELVSPLFTKTNVKANDTTNNLYDLVEKNSYIKVGSKGSIVKHLQNSLLRLGYEKFNITNNKEGCKENFEMCDGVFGEGTKKAVINYQNQKANNLKPDGVVGPSTAQSIINNIEAIE